MFSDCLSFEATICFSLISKVREDRIRYGIKDEDENDGRESSSV